MKRYKKRITSAALAVLMLCTNVGGPAPVYGAQAGVDVDETMYVNLDYYGKTSKVNVVKSCSLNGNTEFTDYGTYENVTNMTDAVQPQLGDGTVSWKLPTEPGGRFYYQCTLNNDQMTLPWDFDVSYKLNGVPVNADRLAGASGLVEINVKADPNDGAREYDRNNMLLMVAVPVDMSKCYSVEAEGSQTQNLGETTAVVFTALPGEEGDYTVRIGTGSFESTGVIMAMVPGTVEDLEHVKDLKKAKDKWQAANDQLYDSLEQMAKSVEGMRDGVNSVKEGTQAAERARQTWSGSKDSLLAGNDQTLAALTAMSGQMETMVPHLQTAKESAEVIHEGMNNIVDTLGEMQDPLRKLHTRLKNVESDMTSLSAELPDIQKLMLQVIELDAAFQYNEQLVLAQQQQLQDAMLSVDDLYVDQTAREPEKTAAPGKGGDGGTQANGGSTQANGGGTQANGGGTQANGGGTQANGDGSTQAAGDGSTQANSGGSTQATGDGSTQANGGGSTQANGGGTQANGGSTQVNGGSSTQATGDGSTQANSGGSTQANGDGSNQANSGSSTQADGSAQANSDSSTQANSDSSTQPNSGSSTQADASVQANGSTTTQANSGSTTQPNSGSTRGNSGTAQGNGTTPDSAATPQPSTPTPPQTGNQGSAGAAEATGATSVSSVRPPALQASVIRHSVPLVGAGLTEEQVTAMFKQKTQSLEQLSKLSSQLVSTMSSTTGDTADAAKYTRELIDNLDFLIEDITALNDSLNVYYPDLQDALTDSKELVNRTTAALNSGISTMSILQNTLKNSSDDFDAAARESLRGSMDLLDQSLSVLDSTTSMRKAGRTMKDTLDNELNQFDTDNRFLFMDPSAPKVSFTSDKNKAPKTLQIVLRTDEISLDDEQNKPMDVEQEKEPSNPLHRMWNVLVKMWHAIVDIFKER